MESWKVSEVVFFMKDLSNDEAALVIREAQATCVRLADDALGAAETSQYLGESPEVGRFLLKQKRLPCF